MTYTATHLRKLRRSLREGPEDIWRRRVNAIFSAAKAAREIKADEY